MLSKPLPNTGNFLTGCRGNSVTVVCISLASSSVIVPNEDVGGISRLFQGLSMSSIVFIMKGGWV
jgi:hypothetical protein